MTNKSWVFAGLKQPHDCTVCLAGLKPCDCLSREFKSRDYFSDESALKTASLMRITQLVERGANKGKVMCSMLKE